MTESEIKRQIKAYLDRLPGCQATVVQLGSIGGRTNSARGMADIIGVYRGRFFAIEVKTPKGVVAPHQQRYIDDVNRAGGLAFVARSLDDVMDRIGPTALNKYAHEEMVT